MSASLKPPRGRIVSRAAQMLDDDAFAKDLGVELVSEDPLTLQMVVADRHLNFLGVGHGGMLFSLADVAFGLASNLPGPVAFAVDTHLVLTAGSHKGDVLTAVVEELARGKTLATYRVLLKRQDGRLAGNFTGTVSLKSTV